MHEKCVVDGHYIMAHINGHISTRAYMRTSLCCSKQEKAIQADAIPPVLLHHMNNQTQIGSTTLAKLLTCTGACMHIQHILNACVQVFATIQFA